ncbi:Acetyltransferase (isoleucine patch superfamily) [Shimia gijangensis]|uniref:Acetyltransferase (Isoleucine patch superfamily) n=1 Tax=Shimia gijangensis TaxID=1470563 RepID=A0A1M6SEX3_9RHOB|nr:acyltransferase [Shimia gijangensis]SHK43048.1 Acetyltransferase (isoleucine patch superfamily) [Shimia gijangensis]
MMKFLFSLMKNSGLFGLPGLRNWRDKTYAKFLNAPGIVVDNFVRIQKLHVSGLKSEFGKDIHVGYGALVDLSGGIKLGDRVTISEGAKIFTHTHPVDRGPMDWRENPIRLSQLEIEADVWIASNAVVLESVARIGAGAIVATGSVVTKNVDTREIVAGVPARHIGYRNSDEF